MTAVRRVQHTETKKAEAKKAEEKKEQVQAKSADVKSTQPSERAKDINRNEEIKDGVFKSRSDSTVGDIAQANAMKEDGTVDPAEVQAQVVGMVKDNPALTAAAKEAGINLDNPTEEDLQKLANLDVKAGQEVKCPAKAEEAKAPEEAAAAEEAKPEEAGKEEKAEEAAPAEGAKGAEEAKKDDSPLAQVMAMIEKAETSTDPAQKRQYADQAIQMIEQLRNEKGVEKGQGQQNQQATNPQGAQNAEGQQLAKTIEAGGKVDGAALDKALEGGDTNQLAQILDSLEMRANKAKNGGNETMNALNLQGQNALNQMNMNSIKLPQMNQAIA